MEVRMWGVRVVWLMGVIVFLAGCASGRSRHELARLQSQVGLLDERITQLERVGLAGTSSTSSFTSELPMDVGSTAVMPSTAPRGSTIRETASSGSFAKPSTRAIQEALKNAGFYQGAVDGKLGPKTKEAIKEFQRVHGLSDDGVVGRRTWAKLRTYADLSAGSAESTTTPLK
jgi:peptidoglycan hydrolase-like protein with peptidoglycan-binding domain